MGWGSNWGFSDPSASRQSAANYFLQTGNFGTALGGTSCSDSKHCASGYACAGGRCVPITQDKGEDGTLSGCGGDGGGPCNSLTDAKVGGGGVSFLADPSAAPKNLRPSGDGCTVSACGVVECGDPGAVDCPSGRQCRYNAFGTVNCTCGDPPQSGCSQFCTAFGQSNGTDADGCTGLACDECEYCEEISVSASGICKPVQNGPCHCNPDELPECVKCNEDGTQVTDDNCLKCVDIFNQPCSCNPDIIVSKRCCYPLNSWESGRSPVNRCQQEIQDDCQPQCDEEPPYVDPCLGTCTDHIICGVTCPSPPGPPPGTDQTITGQIEVPGKCCVLYTDCSDKPDCDECTSDGDCSSCEVCNDGKCAPDPLCSGSFWHQLAWIQKPVDISASKPLGGSCTVTDEGGLIGTVAVAGDSGSFDDSNPGLQWVVVATFLAEEQFAPCASIPTCWGNYNVVQPQTPDGTLLSTTPYTVHTCRSRHPAFSNTVATDAFVWGIVTGTGSTAGEAYDNAVAALP